MVCSGDEFAALGESLLDGRWTVDGWLNGWMDDLKDGGDGSSME